MNECPLEKDFPYEKKIMKMLKQEMLTQEEIEMILLNLLAINSITNKKKKVPFEKFKEKITVLLNIFEKDWPFG